MGIHQLPKAHPQRTIQSAVIIPYLYPTCKNTVPFIYLFSVLRIICYRVPLSASLRTGSSQNENIFSQLLILYERIVLLSFFAKQSLVVGRVDVKHTYKYLQAVLFITGDFLTTVWLPHCQLWTIIEEAASQA